jgi:hypothetical protein
LFHKRVKIGGGRDNVSALVGVGGRGAVAASGHQINMRSVWIHRDIVHFRRTANPKLLNSRKNHTISAA